MRPEVRKSIPTRIVALCFIVMIVLGNIWLAHALVGSSGPSWLMPAIEAVGALTVLSMVVFFGNAIRLYFMFPEPEHDQQAPSGTDKPRDRRS
jgi:hypothetical protein